MRIAIISDVHANLEALEATLRDISGQGVDRVVCLGDVVGYNADPAECVRLLRELDVACVAGNHDRAVLGMITTAGFSERAIRAVRWTRERLTPEALDFLAGLPLQLSIGSHLVAVHGMLLPDGGCENIYLDSEERVRVCFDALARHSSGARVCAYGHTHALAAFELRDGFVRACAGREIPLREGSYYLFNPGTVGDPRGWDEQCATYLVLDTTRQVVSVRRVEYDRSLSALKTRKAGLAPRFARLPTSIRAALGWSKRWLAGHSLKGWSRLLPTSGATGREVSEPGPRRE